jgi:hypothetical protein
MPITMSFTDYVKGQDPVKREIIVPDEQAWLFYKLDEQTKALEKIRNRLTFIILIIILGIFLTLLRGCAGV